MAILFQDRTDAGQKLAQDLVRYADRPDVAVVALPRGGVPIGFVLAQELNVPLDILVVRKLGVPGHQELALGAIAGGGVRILNDCLIQSRGIPDDLIDAITAQEQGELAQRERLYRGSRLPLGISGRTIILVDDGMANGSSMAAAIAAVRRRHPARTVVAVPVASAEACDELRDSVDELVCLAEPEPFLSIGQWYEEFRQVTDREVQDLLEQAAMRQLTFREIELARIDSKNSAGG